MVQEYVSPVRVHKYSFEMVMAAYERRFPSCPQIPVVIECVITEDSWSADDSQRHTTRRCQLNVDAPYLLKKMIGVDYIYFIQKNHLDLKNRMLEIEATNETFAARVSVVEKCRYYVHPENPEWTCFEQSALLDVKNFFGLESTVEKIAMKQYAANIAKGKELIEVFMKEVHTDGVKDLRPWTSSDAGRNRELRRVVSRGTEPLSPRPVAEPKKHSQPGTSKSSGSSNLALRRHSSQKLNKSRSKSALSNREMDSSRLLNQKRSESTGPSDRKNWDLNISKSKQQVNDSSPKKKLNDKKFLFASKSVTRFYNEMQSKSGIWSRTKDDKKKKVVLSNMDLKIRDNNDNRDNEGFKSCTCSSSRSSAAEFVTRWDHLIVMLVCAIILGLLFSTPLSVFFRRAH